MKSSVAYKLFLFVSRRDLYTISFQKHIYTGAFHVLRFNLFPTKLQVITI